MPHAPPPPPPPYTHHNASGATSLLPTPFPASPHQSAYDTSNTKTHGHNARDCGNKYGQGGQGNSSRGQNHGYSSAHAQNTHAKSHNAQGGVQSHNNNKCGGNAADGSHKYPAIAMSSRLPVQYNRRTAGSNVGSSALLRSGYGSGQATHRINHTGTSNYVLQKPNNHGYEHATNGRAKNCYDDQPYYEINGAPNNSNKSAGGYNSGRRNCLSNNNHYRGGAARLDVHAGGDSNGRPNNDTPQTDSAVSATSPTERPNTDTPSAQEKPTSPPPAPYSPMTRPLPTISPPTSQVQFYAPVQNRYQQSSMPPSQQPQQQQQQQQQPANGQRSRYSVGQTLSSTNRKPSDKYSNAAGSQTMLRQSKFKVNGIIQTAATGKLADNDLGGAGDGPGRLPITPPSTPRTGGNAAAGDQNQLSDTCHQIQTLTL